MHPSVSTELVSGARGEPGVGAEGGGANVEDILVQIHQAQEQMRLESINRTASENKLQKEKSDGSLKRAMSVEHSDRAADSHDRVHTPRSGSPDEHNEGATRTPSNDKLQRTTSDKFNSANKTSSVVNRIGKALLDSDEGSDHTGESEEEEEETLQEASRFAFLEGDKSKLLIMMITADKRSVLRTDMNRFDLLEECRKPVIAPSLGSRGEGQHLMGVALQLRDIRFLQGVSEPALLVRRGAIVVSLDPINAIITHDSCFLLVPDGADHVLEPLLAKVREGDVDQQLMPFEFFALEALLVTLITSHHSSVQECMNDAKQVLRQIRKNISSRLLNRVLKLKKRIDAVLDAVMGAQGAIEEVQKDDDVMSLMYLTAMSEDASSYDMQLRTKTCNTEQAELLLDSYALELGALATQLHLVDKEIEATESLLKFKLDTARNTLIKVDVSFGIVAMWLTACSLIAAFYGMNLQNGHMKDKDRPLGYYGPSGIWLEVALISGGLTVFFTTLTLLSLWFCGLFRS